jgi:hypothetical protein
VTDATSTQAGPINILSQPQRTIEAKPKQGHISYKTEDITKVIFELLIGTNGFL